MKDIILDVLEQSGTLSMQAIALHIIVAACLGVVIYVSYWYTHTGTAYSKKFNVSLITLTILTATVMTVIGNNIALSLCRCFYRLLRSVCGIAFIWTHPQ